VDSSDFLMPAGDNQHEGIRCEPLTPNHGWYPNPSEADFLQLITCENRLGPRVMLKPRLNQSAGPNHCRGRIDLGEEDLAGAAYR
jgi:hypothetical protein